MKGTLNANESPVWMESLRNQHSLSNGIFGEKEIYAAFLNAVQWGKVGNERGRPQLFSRVTIYNGEKWYSSTFQKIA